ncbi:MAG TPA: methylmalonyl-CoA mutase, partial [Hyphomonas sp.]|nr:methylmalonyl-CoA mutase [Hyphomonas sp.]
AALIASAVDTLRRLDNRTDISALIPRMSFALALDGNYGLGVAKLRAARRLWARILDAMDQQAVPMRLQAVSSGRMLTRYDAWTNMLRNTAAAFAGAVGGADILTIRPFNEALGIPEELGRRIARNTQIIAMEESQLGRVADPT